MLQKYKKSLEKIILSFLLWIKDDKYRKIYRSEESVTLSIFVFQKCFQIKLHIWNLNKISKNII